MNPRLTKKDKFLYFHLAVFILIASGAVYLGSGRTETILGTKAGTAPEISAILPILEKETTFPVLSAQAALAVDLDSQITLYEKDPDKLLLPASTTKIVSALVVMNYYKDDQVLTVKNIKVEGQKMGLILGEEIKVKDLLYGLLVYSANDAAETLAQNFNGGRDAFILAMNEKAKELRLDNSNFTNPTGLDTDGDHIVSTARDLVKISSYAMQNPEFAEIVKTEKITVTSTDGKIIHRLTNVNELLGKVPGVLGIKTGWTENARENLVTYLERDNHKVMMVVLGSQDRFGETKELINWIFANYSWQEVKVPYSP